MELVDLIKKEVETYYRRAINKGASDHVVNIAASIILDRFGVIPGAGFVKRFNANDLSGSVGSADEEIGLHLRDLVRFSCNFRLSRDLLNRVI